MRPFVYFVCLFACLWSRPAHASVNVKILQFDLQSGFDGSKVTVEVDGRKEFDERATTNPIIGLAGRFTFRAKDDVIRVKIKCLRMEYVTDLKLKHGLYVGIGVQRGQIVVGQRKSKFFYD